MQRLRTHQLVAVSLAAAGMALLGAMTAFAAQEETAAKPKQPHVVLEVQGLHYDVGKPVLVRATIRNDGDTEVDNPLTDPIAAGLRVHDPDGKIWKPTGLDKASPQDQPKRLGPRSYFGQVLDISPNFPVLAKLGRYEVTYEYGDEQGPPVTVNIIPAFNPNANYKAVVKTAVGEFTIQLYREDAPLTVRTFVDLSRQGFYNGLVFHYVKPGDILIGGDPNGDGSGGSGFFLPAEFNSRQHLAGTVAMVRGAEPDSASSQFYICLKPEPERDGKFTVFGQVVDGMDTLGRLAETPTSGISSKPFYRPLKPLVMESVTIIETPVETDAGS